MKRRTLTGADWSIDLTPGINIALLLVLVFVLGAAPIFQTWLSVTAPKVKKAPFEKRSPTTEFKVNIHIKENGQIVLNEQAVTYEKLDTLLPELLARSPSRLVIVSADSLVPHGKVVEILDLAKQKGAVEVALLRRK